MDVLHFLLLIPRQKAEKEKGEFSQTFVQVASAASGNAYDAFSS